ncbi:MAG: hypothetical protein R3240_04175, partial [Gammaproteobacteria bacterium]|nr:hypothetical protein [Gammaproteobacteria bacterium]
LQNTKYSKLPTTGSATCPTGTTTTPCAITDFPYSGSLNLHSLSATYYQTRSLNWKMVFNYASNTLNMYEQSSTGAPVTAFATNSSGIGDVQLFMSNKLTETDWFDINFTLGINLPLGNIDQAGGLPNSNDMAPYRMQLGSGTYDLHTALDFQGKYYEYEYGAQLYKITRTGVNVQYYNRGDSLSIKGWGRYNFSTGTQLRASLTQNIQAPVEGQDQRISVNTKYTGGKRLDLTVGAGQNFKEYLIYLDYTYPMLQYQNGVQIKTTGIINFGLRYNYM